MYDKRWKESADELRQEGSKLQNLETRIEQQNQMRVRKQKEEISKEEAMLYDTLWKRDYAQRVARDEAEARKLQEMNQARVTALNAQTDSRANVRQADAQAHLDEKRLMTQTWHQQKLEADAQDYQRFLQNRDMNNLIIAENKVTKKNAKKEYKRELKSDKAMINALVSKEEADKLREWNHEQDLRNEAKEMMGFTSLRAQQEAEMEKMIEDHANMENEKQWQRTEAKWAAEEHARVALMQDVYDSRYQNILMRKAQTAQEQQEEMVRAERIKQEEQEAFEKEQFVREDRRRARVEAQGDIRFQMADAQARQQAEIREDMHARRAGQLAEMDYVRQINAEKAKNAEIQGYLQQQRF